MIIMHLEKQKAVVNFSAATAWIKQKSHGQRF